MLAGRCVVRLVDFTVAICVESGNGRVAGTPNLVVAGFVAVVAVESWRLVGRLVGRTIHLVGLENVAMVLAAVAPVVGGTMMVLVGVVVVAGVVVLHALHKPGQNPTISGSLQYETSLQCGGSHSPLQLRRLVVVAPVLSSRGGGMGISLGLGFSTLGRGRGRVSRE